MATFSSQREAEASRVRRRLGNGTEYEITSYLGAGMPKDAVGPVGYLVEQERNSTILPHFHQANQFQVVVAGGGLLGKLPVGPVTVHYAGAFTPYGPIVSAEDGLFYFTLRDAFDPGARFMPESRAELPRVTRRHAAAHADRPLEPPALAGLDAADRQTLIETTEDGLGAWRLRLPPGAAWSGPEPASGGGQFHLVVSGEAAIDGQELGSLALIHVRSDEAPPALAAGPAGAEVLVMQFPRRSA